MEDRKKKNIRQRSKKFRKNLCELCKQPSKYFLHNHHPDIFGNPDYTITMCLECHKTISDLRSKLKGRRPDFNLVAESVGVDESQLYLLMWLLLKKYNKQKKRKHSFLVTGDKGSSQEKDKSNDEKLSPAKKKYEDLKCNRVTDNIWQNMKCIDAYSKIDWPLKRNRRFDKSKSEIEELEKECKCGHEMYLHNLSSGFCEECKKYCEEKENNQSPPL